MSIVKRTWKINGKTLSVRAPAARRLLDFLREDLGLVGSKEGCGEGECGACTVLVDNEPIILHSIDSLLTQWQCRGVSASSLDTALATACAMTSPPGKTRRSPRSTTTPSTRWCSRPTEATCS